MAIAKVNGSKAAEDFLAKAGWSVSSDEERAILGTLNDGRSPTVELSRNLKFALESIAGHIRKLK